MSLGIKIKHERQARRWTQKRLAAELDVSVQAISQWENDVTFPTGEKLLSLIKLGFDVWDEERRWDLVPSPSAGEAVPVPHVGTVAAGMFQLVEDIDQSEPEISYLPPDPQFPNARRMIFDVEGTSMNALQPRPILPGDKAVCVAYEDIAHAMPLRDGMVVVVQRTRDGGHLREWSIKQIEYYEDRIEFHPRSTDASYKPIVVPHDYDADEGTAVEIIALLRMTMTAYPIF